jgi:hypothetical protein
VTSSVGGGAPQVDGATEERSTFLQLAHRLIPPAIDLASLAGFFFLTPWLGARIFTPSPAGQIFLVPGFFLIVAGVYAIRSLPRYSLDDSKGPSLLAMCLIFFQMVIYSLLYVYATNIGGSEQENDGIAVVIFFVFLLPVIGAFRLPATRARPGTTRALVAESVGLFSVNYMTIIGASVWHYFISLPTSEDPVYATGIWFLILYVLIYLLFLAFFGLPRLYLLRATGDKFGLTIYLVGLAVFLWDKVPPVN